MRTFNSLLRNDRGGFTLLELLVVLGIIGLLTALTVPIVSQVRQSARNAVSINNMRSWGTALHMYLTHNEGWMPAHGPEAQPSWAEVANVENEEVSEAWYNALPSLVNEQSLYSLSASGRPESGFLREQSIHRDPRAKVERQQVNVRPVFSYAMNEDLNTSASDESLRYASLRLSRYQRLSNTVLLFETRVGPQDGHPSESGVDDFGRAYGSTRHVSFRSGGKAHVLFLDASVRPFDSEEVYSGNNSAIHWVGLD